MIQSEIKQKTFFISLPFINWIDPFIKERNKGLLTDSFKNMIH